jgi:Ca2+-binding RTX toxin-like protein
VVGDLDGDALLAHAPNPRAVIRRGDTGSFKRTTGSSEKFVILMTMFRPIHALLLLLALGLAAAAAAGAASHASTARFDVCSGHRTAGATCVAGNGRRSRGGNGKVSHAGWPAVTGILWLADAGGRTDSGTRLNDEILGLHGNDTLSGGPGRDILWGDQLPNGNNTWQHDTLNGGPGKDWIYSSHGRNTIHGGSGNDHIWGHFGHGSIDCGRGYDIVHVKHHPTYRLRRCETVLHH